MNVAGVLLLHSRAVLILVFMLLLSESRISSSGLSQTSILPKEHHENAEVHSLQIDASANMVVPSAHNKRVSLVRRQRGRRPKDNEALAGWQGHQEPEVRSDGISYSYAQGANDDPPDRALIEYEAEEAAIRCPVIAEDIAAQGPGIDNCPDVDGYYTCFTGFWKNPKSGAKKSNYTVTQCAQYCTNELSNGRTCFGFVMDAPKKECEIYEWIAPEHAKHDRPDRCDTFDETNYCCCNYQKCAYKSARLQTTTTTSTTTTRTTSTTTTTTTTTTSTSTTVTMAELNGRPDCGDEGVYNTRYFQVCWNSYCGGPPPPALGGNERAIDSSLVTYYNCMACMDETCCKETKLGVTKGLYSRNPHSDLLGMSCPMEPHRLCSYDHSSWCPCDYEDSLHISSKEKPYRASCNMSAEEKALEERAKQSVPGWPLSKVPTPAPQHSPLQQRNSTSFEQDNSSNSSSLQQNNSSNSGNSGNSTNSSL
eukprot:gnl/TRDRNA2_/TRDRNA2_181435_c0_seq1.p1 gnl/TRDRNA2_/TRDRNA2_181435_c0~~gnl/TRDRNA2_/TRDRNA2_181435_c0_seq1.p1  ORF type:complete len:479 (-),score=52.60 gnl/TRDRNA2_/TRDRNA2_181435_c0_seq1:139-1575(-)